MNRTANFIDRVYCVDLAKNKFQLHTYSADAERIGARTLSRSKFDAFFANPAHAGALVVMEACASSQYWARTLLARGYRVKLVPAQFVAKLRHGNKTDGNDADAIHAVHRDPRVRPVPVKSLEQHDICAMHRARELLTKHRVACTNHVRGLLAERGCVAAQGAAGFSELLTGVLGNPPAEVTAELAATIALMAEQIRALQAHLDAIDARLKVVRAQSPVAQRLDGIFGIGHVTATALVGEYGHSVARFADARQFAANLGITPSEHSSGAKRRLGAITKRGNPYLRKLLVQCGQSVVNSVGRREDAICRFAQRLLAQGKRRNTVIVAVANRLARIIYAVLKHQTEYRPNPGLANA
jgi:transposase